MAKKTPAAPQPGRPQLHVRDWLAQHPELAVESVAGFVVHVGRAAWDTADQWAERWHAWLTHPHQGGQ